MQNNEQDDVAVAPYGEQVIMTLSVPMFEDHACHVEAGKFREACTNVVDLLDGLRRQSLTTPAERELFTAAISAVVTAKAIVFEALVNQIK